MESNNFHPAGGGFQKQRLDLFNGSFGLAQRAAPLL
jgi:hypothetical protein